MLKNMDELPKWDVAIEGMVNEENKKKNRPLSLEDFKGLAKAYDFRLDDIFETVLFLISIRMYSSAGFGYIIIS